jgi:hypothetical protein
MPASGSGDAIARGPSAPDGGTRAAGDPMEEVRSGRRRGAGAAVVASAVIITGVAVWFIQQHTPAQPRDRTGEVGSIIYTAGAQDGQTRLYRWDLFAGTITRGPVVRDPLALFDAEAAHPGWVGIESRSPTGGVDIGVFKFLGPDDQTFPLGHGAVAAWAPQGANIVVGTAASSSGCSYLHVLAIHLSPLTKEESAGERVCAQLDGVQLGERTFLSLRGSAGTRVAYLSVHRLRPLLNHYRLDSLSPANDMVVTPDPPPGSPSVPGSALYFRGPASQRPIPYTFAGSPFVLDRVLAWDPSATEALALGSAGGRSGFYRLQAAPPIGDTQPQTQPATYIGPAQGHADALYTGVGTRLVFSGGQFSRVFDDSTTPFPMPLGAPVPAGPMVWVGP